MLTKLLALAGVSRRRPGAPRPEAGCAPTEKAAPPELDRLVADTLGRDLSLAAEHLRSIRCLLEIAREHRQPIPAAALTNLELVTRSLGEMQRQIRSARGEVSAAADPAETPAPPRPRRPSSECRVSPSGR